GTEPVAQIELAQIALANGAAWLILQPPPARSMSEDELLRFFSAVMERVRLPVAIQNAPQFLGVGLGDASLAELARRHEHFRLLKAESSALALRRTVEMTEGRLAIFNGRAGLELPDNLRAGCAGIIPSVECCDREVEIYELMRRGDEESVARAEAIYREI